MTYLVDTDVIIDWLLNVPHAVQTLRELQPGGLAVSLATYGELLAGVPYSRNPEGSERAIRTFCKECAFFPLTVR